MKAPAWMRARIVSNQRKAKVTGCACGAPVVVGLDADQCAFNVAADVLPVTWPGELAAVLQGRGTFSVALVELTRREAHDRTKPAAAPVLVEHRCGEPLPSTWLADTPAPVVEEPSDDAPF